VSDQGGAFDHLKPTIPAAQLNTEMKDEIAPA
jgi:hypothetical protein